MSTIEASAGVPQDEIAVNETPVTRFIRELTSALNLPIHPDNPNAVHKMLMEQDAVPIISSATGEERGQLRDLMSTVVHRYTGGEANDPGRSLWEYTQACNRAWK